MRVNPLAWPLAIVSSLLYCALFADSRLYGEAGAADLLRRRSRCWGWWQWLRGTRRDGAPLRVRALDRAAARWPLLAATGVAWPLLALLLAALHRHRRALVRRASDRRPACIGQCLLGRKFVENWPVWIAVNVVSVGLFAHKGLWLTVAAVRAVRRAVGGRLARLAAAGARAAADAMPPHA